MFELILYSSKRLIVMSFECRSNALSKLLFVSKRTFQYAYHVTTCPALGGYLCLFMFLLILQG